MKISLETFVLQSRHAGMFYLTQFIYLTVSYHHTKLSPPFLPVIMDVTVQFV